MPKLVKERKKVITEWDTNHEPQIGTELNLIVLEDDTEKFEIRNVVGDRVLPGIVIEKSFFNDLMNSSFADNYIRNEKEERQDAETDSK